MTTAASPKKYRVVGLGGTFDHFHQGHAWFVEQAATYSDLLVVGVTTTVLLQEKTAANSIESYETRAKSVGDFLAVRQIPHEIVPLSDVAGPTLTDPRIEAVIVTEDTLQGGEVINQLRATARLKPLVIEVVELQQTENGQLLSSHSIRAGTHNRVGAAYLEVLRHRHVLTDDQRQAMRVVQGKIVTTIPKNDTARYLVGDSTLRRFLQEDQPYAMAIIDGKERRETYYPLVIDATAIDLVLINPAGAITPMLARGLSLAVRHQLTHIFVDGEEDLAAVVLQLVLPLGSTIYYGQPDKGVVRWEVSEEAKEKTALLLNPHFQTNPKLVE